MSAFAKGETEEDAVAAALKSLHPSLGFRVGERVRHKTVGSEGRVVGPSANGTAVVVDWDDSRTTATLPWSLERLGWQFLGNGNDWTFRQPTTRVQPWDSIADQQPSASGTEAAYSSFQVPVPCNSGPKEKHMSKELTILRLTSEELDFVKWAVHDTAERVLHSDGALSGSEAVDRLTEKIQRAIDQPEQSLPQELP